MSTPQVGETVDVTEATNLYRIHLKSNFLESFKFVPLGPKEDHQIAYVDGLVMVPPAPEDRPWQQPEPYLDVLPNDLNGHEPIFVGDVKLSSFKSVCEANNLKAEFKSGVLIINDSVALRIVPDSDVPRVHMDGVISEDYYKVRDLLYKQYQIL